MISFSWVPPVFWTGTTLARIGAHIKKVKWLAFPFRRKRAVEKRKTWVFSFAFITINKSSLVGTEAKARKNKIHVRTTLLSLPLSSYNSPVAIM